MDDLANWIGFAALRGVSLTQKHLLLSKFGAVDKILKLDPASLNLNLTPSHPSLGHYCDQKLIDTALNWLSKSTAHTIVRINDLHYPYLLRQISAPPLLLYLSGNGDLLSNRQIAIVGSRKASTAGMQTAEKFAAQLSQAGLTITSGLALGIDGFAHSGALIASGHTIAVLGTGINRCYPSRHRKLYQQIEDQGLLVSEFSLDTAPLPHHFPRRNRIISGLSIGTLVIEAAQKSGSLITANYALAQNREVFAIPGSIQNLNAAGCLGLIQQGAKLTRTINDILVEFSEFSAPILNNGHSSEISEKLNSPIVSSDLNADQLLVFNLIDDVPMSFDKLITHSGLTLDLVCSILLDLELTGKIERLPGNKYLRTAT